MHARIEHDRKLVEVRPCSYSMHEKKSCESGVLQLAALSWRISDLVYNDWRLMRTNASLCKPSGRTLSPKYNYIVRVNAMWTECEKRLATGGIAQNEVVMYFVTLDNKRLPWRHHTDIWCHDSTSGTSSEGEQTQRNASIFQDIHERSSNCEVVCGFEQQTRNGATIDARTRITSAHAQHHRQQRRTSWGKYSASRRTCIVTQCR